MKIRQDAWSEENDLLLAETVLRHIREGSTQLNAFEEVGDQLNRTSAACGFRWNAVVRQKYEQAVQLAKKQRKELKKSIQIHKKKQQAPVNSYQNHRVEIQPQLPPPQVMTTPASLTIPDVIQFLQQLNIESGNSYALKLENETLKRQNEELTQKIDHMDQQIKNLEKEHTTMQEDYQSLMQIMDRARKMVLFQENDTPSTSFRMDKNGNLEKIAK